MSVSKREADSRGQGQEQITGLQETLGRTAPRPGETLQVPGDFSSPEPWGAAAGAQVPPHHTVCWSQILSSPPRALAAARQEGRALSFPFPFSPEG